MPAARVAAMSAAPDDVILHPDQRQAVDHLLALDETAETFTFQTFDDNRRRKDKRLARILHGTLIDVWPELERLNRKGAGIFVTVNETDGTGRRLANIVRARAVFQEDDGAGKPLPLEPHLLIESSPGKYHRYLLVEDLALDEFDAVQRVLVEDYGSDPNAKDRARVLRLAGFYHRKGAPHLVRIVEASGSLPYGRERLLEAFPPKPEPSSRVPGTSGQGAPQDADAATLAKVRKLATDAALRTHEDGTRGRHAEVVLLGHILRRELGDGLPGEALDEALRTFEANMRHCDTAGEVQPMNWHAERRALEDAYRSPSRPDREPADTGKPSDEDEDDAGLRPVSARDLFARQFDPLHWNIQDILPAGTTLLFGKPKKGKSFLTLLIAISVAAGRPVFGKATSGRPVLYLGLEDSERRAQRRLKGCAKALEIPPEAFIDKLHVSTSSARIDTGLLDELRGWMKAHPDTGLIVIDMLKKVTGAEDNRKSLYNQQAEVGDALTKFSHEWPSLSILVVHHSRKAESDDPFDLVSGTTGLSGSYDSLAAISDIDKVRYLHITGRDIEAADIPLRMSPTGMYTLAPVTTEELQTADMSDNRRRVFDAVPRGQAYSRADIIAGCKLPEGIVDQMLRRLAKQGLIHKPDRGMYQKTDKRWFDVPGNLEGYL
jgi:hypothetical protein